MHTKLFTCRATERPSARPEPVPDAAFAARPRLVQLRDALIRAEQPLRPSRWNEPVLFFFDRKREAELKAARSTTLDRFSELAELIAAEMPLLIACAEVRRVARAVDGLKHTAQRLASRCLAAKELADLLAVPDDEVFLALLPTERTGVRLHVRGAADVAQFHCLLVPALTGARATADASFQLFLPAALREDASLPFGFAGCEHWLWPNQPLAAVPRISGERVVLVGPAFVRPSLDVDPRFPKLVAEGEIAQTLHAVQVAECLSRLIGRPVPPKATSDAPAIARAA